MTFPIGSTAIGQWWTPEALDVAASAPGNYNYARLSATAERLLNRFGQFWTITTTTGPAEATSRIYPGVQIDTITHLLGDSGVQIGDAVLLLHGRANPLQGDRITAPDGTNYVLIVEPKPIKPAALVLVWYAWGRRG